MKEEGRKQVQVYLPLDLYRRVKFVRDSLQVAEYTQPQSIHSMILRCIAAGVSKMERDQARKK